MGVAVTTYALVPPGWPDGLRLRAAVLSDLHASWPWTSERRIAGLVAQVNGLGADIVLLLGDFVHALDWLGCPVAHARYAAELAKLTAPLGVHGVLGNHDWKHDRVAQRRGAGPTACGEALVAADIPVYENRAMLLEKDGRPFWLAGLGDQRAFRIPGGRGLGKYRGVDDLDGTLAQVSGDAPVILMAHEPDIFPRVPARVSLTLSGHTHGGQINLFGWTPVVPSYYGSRYVYGHIVEDGRHLIVSAGFGFSGVPLRIGARPEIVLLELGR